MDIDRSTERADVRAHSQQKSVALVRSHTRAEGVYEALSRAKDSILPALRETVYVKPNLGCGHIPRTHVMTHAEALEGLAAFLVENHVRRIVVFEGAPSTSIKFGELRFRALAKRFPLNFVDLTSEIRWRALSLVDMEGREQSARVSATIAEASCRISLALPKTHDLVVASLGLKNMMGAVHPRDREKMHGVRSGLWVYTRQVSRLSGLARRMSPAFVRTARRGLTRVQLALGAVLGSAADPRYLYESGRRPPDLVRSMSRVLGINIARMSALIAPHVTVIDGRVGVEGEGPTNGDPVELGCALAGTDPIAVDAVAASVMGFDPNLVPYLRELCSGKLLPSPLLLGESIPAVRRAFRPHADFSALL